MTLSTMDLYATFNINDIQHNYKKLSIEWHYAERTMLSVAIT
jgi:hypothetical protein